MVKKQNKTPKYAFVEVSTDDSDHRKAIDMIIDSNSLVIENYSV